MILWVIKSISFDSPGRELVGAVFIVGLNRFLPLSSRDLIFATYCPFNFSAYVKPQSFYYFQN